MNLATKSEKLKIHFHEEEAKFTGKFKAEIFETLRTAYRPEMTALIVVLILGLLGRAALLANANIIGFWVDSYCKDASLCKTPPQWTSQFDQYDFITLLAVLSSLGFVFTLIFRISFSRISAHAVSRIYDAVTLRVSRFPMSFFDRTPVGRIVTRFSSDYGNIFRMFGGPLAEFIAIIFDLVMMVFLISVAHPLFLLFISIGSIFYYMIYRSHRDVLRRERRELSRSRSPSIAHFAETAQGASSIRTYLRQAVFIKRFEFQNSYFLSQKRTTVKKLTLFSLQMNAVTALLMATTGISSYFLLKSGNLGIGAIGVALTFIAYASNTIQMFFEWLTQFEEAIIGLERLDQYLRLPLELGTTERPSLNAKPTSRWEGLKSAKVEFSGLEFRYRNDLPLVLKNVSLTVEAGEKFGIVGRTGSGKSSLISALFYLYPFQAGQISIHGLTPNLDPNSTSSQKISLDEYRQAFSYVSQEPTLFRGSLRDNLSGEPGTADSSYIEVLNQVGLGDWYLSLPKGLSSQIEERGKNLSQGEKQLICMARCLLQQTPVIVMDEATASVDPQSEELMVNATEKLFKGKTQIIIAHRLSTLLKCDRILWLDEGAIKMIGTPDEVLKSFTQFGLTGELL